MPEREVTTIVCDDNELVVFGLKTVLGSNGFNVVGHATDGREAIEMVAELHPEVVIMDLIMPNIDGIEATQTIKERWPETKVLVVTASSDEKKVLAALASGADGYCLKEAPVDNTVMAARALCSGGGMWLDPGIAMSVLRNSAKEALDAAQPGPEVDPGARFRLSQREMEVLGLVVQGLSNQEIGTRLFVSAETVKTHLRHIMEKLKVEDRVQAAVKAVREGLVRNDG